MDKKTAETVRLLAPYMAVFPHSKLGEQGLILFAEALSDLSLEEINAAMIKILRTSDYFPSVAEIYKQAEEIKSYAMEKTTGHKEALTPAEAWEEAMENVKVNHLYKPWEYSSHEVEQAVNQFGKADLCELEIKNVNTARAQFMRIYSQILEVKKEKDINNKVLEKMGNNVKALIDNTTKRIGVGKA